MQSLSPYAAGSLDHAMQSEGQNKHTGIGNSVPNTGTPIGNPEVGIYGDTHYISLGIRILAFLASAGHSHSGPLASAGHSHFGPYNYIHI